MSLKRSKLIAERRRFNQKAKSKIKSADRAELLAAGIAHEFNNILGSIDGHAEWALSSKKLENCLEALATIRVACERSAQITRALQRFNQPREETRKVLNLKKVIQDVAASLKPKLDKFSLSLRLEIEPNLKILASETQIFEILFNLLKNSMESLRGLTTVDLSREHLGIKAYKKKSAIAVEVWDRGPGISKALQPLLFRPFFTTKGVLKNLHQTNTSDLAGLELGAGSGLGLFMAKTFAEENGAKLSLQESDKNLTVFTLRFS